MELATSNQARRHPGEARLYRLGDHGPLGIVERKKAGSGLGDGPDRCVGCGEAVEQSGEGRRFSPGLIEGRALPFELRMALPCAGFGTRHSDT